MTKHFIKIVHSTSPKNKLQEAISEAVETLDKTLWPSLEAAHQEVFKRFKEAESNYTGKCTVKPPSGLDHEKGGSTCWICDMITLAIYDVREDFTIPGQIIGTVEEQWDDNTFLQYIENRSYEGNPHVYLDFYFLFCGREYIATLSTKDIETDSHDVCLEGDSIFFSSFEDLLQDDLWDKLVSRANEYLEQLKLEQEDEA